MSEIIHIPRREDSKAECGIETGLGWSAGVIDYYMKDLCFECIRKHPKIVQLEAMNERLREYYEASEDEVLKEDILSPFDQYHEATKRLERATKALKRRMR